MRVCIPLLLVLFSQLAFGQNSQHGKPDVSLTRADYIELYAPFAVKEMLESGVPASITLAQGILESGDGNSALARNANNHFGIKCHGVWEGKKYHMDDDAKHECFRVYESVFESYRDHSHFLKSRERYAKLFELRRTDYKGWAQGLKDAGYATNPKYPALLIKIIEENDLAKYDRMDTPPKGRAQENVGSEKGRKGNSHHTTKQNEAIVSTLSRQLYLRNEIRYVIVQEGDTYQSLERMLQVRKWQLLKYNDKLNPDLIPGEMLYLQPKRSRNPQHDYHMVAAGETMRWISQEYGIKLKQLYKYNNLAAGEEPAPETKIWLRKRKHSEY